MPKNVIRLNDPTSHGGKVASVTATHFTVGGIAIARLGDKCTCPLHGDGTIIEGDTRHTVDGIPVAYEGHKTSCGATLTSTVANFNRV
ncbi:MAG: PAAR domain-containing protein [Pseudomonadota bacterium]